MPVVSIIMGSDSDLPVMQEAGRLFDEFGVDYEITIISAHRTPERMFEFAKNAPNRGIKVIIAGAGGAAHLPGMVASITHLPVIGVPVKSSNMSGIDSLLSIVQMPPGVPVATMAINGSKNAALFAVQILGVCDAKHSAKIREYKEELKNNVIDKAKRLEEDGFKDYMSFMNSI